MKKSDLKRNQLLQEDNYKYRESLCGNCGACSWVLDDPCVHLK
ncbi:MAG: putative cysteine cluster protein YcgN (CxxCxxCC family), partial [Candidatus Omnitrophota bacterium]